MFYKRKQKSRKQWEIGGKIAAEKRERKKRGELGWRELG